MRGADWPKLPQVKELIKKAKLCIEKGNKEEAGRIAEEIAGHGFSMYAAEIYRDMGLYKNAEEVLEGSWMNKIPDNPYHLAMKHISNGKYEEAEEIAKTLNEMGYKWLDKFITAQIEKQKTPHDDRNSGH